MGCAICVKELRSRKANGFLRTYKKYCSYKCRLVGLHKENIKYPRKFCLVCGEELKRKHIDKSKLCSMKCFSIYAKKTFKKGKLHPRYNGNIYEDGNGYLRMYDETSPKKYNSLHRMIMEKHIGRKLTRDECVHHINSDKMDNRLKNLELISRAEHCKRHAIEFRRRKRNNSLS